MAEQASPSAEASAEQIIYARTLEKGMLIGLFLLFVTFPLYVLGIMNPYIPLNAVSRYWSLSVADYLHAAEVEAGWSWVTMLGYGDFVNFIGVAFLAGTTVICYLSIIPTLLRNNDKIYAVLALVQVLVLSVAASGILGSGGH